MLDTVSNEKQIRQFNKKIFPFGDDAKQLDQDPLVEQGNSRLTRRHGMGSGHQRHRSTHRRLSSTA